MTPEETIEAARALDRLLHDAIRESKMPEIGGKRLAGGLGSLFSDLRKKAEAARERVMAAGAELHTELDAMAGVEKAIKDETLAVRAAVNDILGNDRGESAAAEPPQTKP